MSTGPHTPKSDPINNTLDSLTVADDIVTDHQDDRYNIDDRRRNRTDDDDLKYRRRRSTSRSLSPRRPRSRSRTRSPRRTPPNRRSRSPRTPQRERDLYTYRPLKSRPYNNDHHYEPDRRERDERHPNSRELHRERDRERRDNLRSRSRDTRETRVLISHRPDKNYSQRLSARETAGRQTTFSKNTMGRISPKPSSNYLQAINASQRSQKECRVYVGNLAYEVKWAQLKDFMRQAGEVVFADVLIQPNGMSKGCGVVEYRTPEEARRAIETLNDTQLLGRPVFIREDRETEAKFGTGLNLNRTERIMQLPYSVGWQELKDLFRNAGNIIRADILVGQDRRSKGSGTVLFETPGDAANAISMYDGYEMNGRRIEVREDRFAGGPPPPRFTSRPTRPYTGPSNYGHNSAGGFYGPAAVPPTGYGSTYQSIGPGPEQYDGYGGGYNDFNTAGAGIMDYNGGGFGGSYIPPYGGATGGYDGSASYFPPGTAGGSGTQIFVRNLPFTTTNLDLRDLFKYCGNVLRAEILEQNGRPKGAGVVQFDSNESARIAVEKFGGYTYGGRIIDVNFDRYA
ncbi:3284_t:CDS:10 [Diversispora eburnea]|uniref:3284_t:CDS:1 n=1 Tax=Diversispora eburnea TaxID=1213867 RepID=A0A9N9F8E0_9GLOM|nr:3284_t:CDS:10 [Diversispora eburnea]